MQDELNDFIGFPKNYYGKRGEETKLVYDKIRRMKELVTVERTKIEEKIPN